MLTYNFKYQSVALFNPDNPPHIRLVTADLNNPKTLQYASDGKGRELANLNLLTA